MFPGIEPFLIGKHISYGIIRDILIAVLGQQVSPIGIAVGIGYSCTTGKTGCSGGGIGIFLAAQDIAGFVIGPDIGPARLGVVFTDQLPRSIVLIADDRCAVQRNGTNVAPVVILIRIVLCFPIIGDSVSGRNVTPNLPP